MSACPELQGQLHRQSIEVNRNAPLLWWGKYVDFGSFDEAVNRRAQEKEITFRFVITVTSEVLRYRSPFSGVRQGAKLAGPTEFSVAATMAKSEQGTYVSRVEVKVHDLTCTIKIGTDQMVEEVRCGRHVWVPGGGVVGHTVNGDLLPEIVFGRLSPRQDNESEQRFNEVHPLTAFIGNSIKQYVHGNTTDNTVRNISQRFFMSAPDELLERLKRSASPASWYDNIRTFNEKSPSFTGLRQAYLISNMQSLLQTFNSELNKFGRGVRYLEPLRATAERNYRQQELSLDEIDSKGANLAIFINNLKDLGRLGGYNSWMREHLGLEVWPHLEAGQISLKVSFDSGEATNLVDMGFGLSQVLPVATQLWVSSSPEGRRAFGAGLTTCLVIEQPELHLHPAFQGKIADLLHGAIKRRGEVDNVNKKMSIIVETHSSSLINRLGELVADGSIATEDIQVLLFESDAVGGDTVVRHAYFNEDGVLENWPFGFFSGGVGE